MSNLDENFDNQLAAFMGGEKVEEVKEPEQVASVSEEETIQEPIKPAEPTTADKAKALGWNPDKDEFEAAPEWVQNLAIESSEFEEVSTPKKAVKKKGK